MKILHILFAVFLLFGAAQAFLFPSGGGGGGGCAPPLVPPLLVSCL